MIAPAAPQLNALQTEGVRGALPQPRVPRPPAIPRYVSVRKPRIAPVVRIKA